MGMSNTTCSVSNLTISEDDGIVLQLMVKTYSADIFKSYIMTDYESQSLYNPFGFPIFGKYNGYQGIENVKQDNNLKLIESFFGCDITTLVEYIDQGGKIECKNKNILDKIYLTYFNPDVYNYLTGDWTKLKSTNKDDHPLIKMSKERIINFVNYLIDKGCNEVAHLYSYIPKYIDIHMYRHLNIDVNIYEDEIYKQYQMIFKVKSFEKKCLCHLLMVHKMIIIRKYNNLLTY